VPVRADVHTRFAAVAKRVTDQVALEDAVVFGRRQRRAVPSRPEPTPSSCPLARLVAGAVPCADILATGDAAELLNVSAAVFSGYTTRRWIVPFAKFANVYLYRRADVEALQRRLQAFDTL
jgi:hypothetical protein